MLAVEVATVVAPRCVALGAPGLPRDARRDLEAAGGADRGPVLEREALAGDLLGRLLQARVQQPRELQLLRQTKSVHQRPANRAHTTISHNTEQDAVPLAHLVSWCRRPVANLSQAVCSVGTS